MLNECGNRKDIKQTGFTLSGFKMCYTITIINNNKEEWS